MDDFKDESNVSKGDRITQFSKLPKLKNLILFLADCIFVQNSAIPKNEVEVVISRPNKRKNKCGVCHSLEHIRSKCPLQCTAPTTMSSSSASSSDGTKLHEADLALSAINSLATEQTDKRPGLSGGRSSLPLSAKLAQQAIKLELPKNQEKQTSDDNYSSESGEEICKVPDKYTGNGGYCRDDTSDLSEYLENTRMRKFSISVQQQNIIDTARPPGVINLIEQAELFRITAAAGTGKTTTLQLLCSRLQELGHTAITYVTFNKSAARDARLRFGPSVSCVTLHSCAFQIMGFKELNQQLVSSWDFENKIGEWFHGDISHFLEKVPEDKKKAK